MVVVAGVAVKGMIVGRLRGIVIESAVGTETEKVHMNHHAHIAMLMHRDHTADRRLEATEIETETGTETGIEAAIRELAMISQDEPEVEVRGRRKGYRSGNEISTAKMSGDRTLRVGGGM